MTSRRAWVRDPVVLLICILAIALLLRLWGIDYGLPYSYWIDEYHEVLRALELGSGGFNFDRSTKGGFYLLLFVEYGVYYVVLKLAGAVGDPGEFAQLFVRDPSVFYLLGRATAAIFGALTIAAVFLLARRAYSRAAGLLAALFFSVNILHVDLSHRIGVDVPMTFLATLALFFAVRIAHNGQRRDYLLAALCAALATTTKLPAILLTVPLVLCHAYAVSREGGGFRAGFASANVWKAVSVFLVVLVATNPGILGMAGLVDFGGNAEMTAGEGVMDDADGMLLQERPNLYLYYLAAVANSMGWPLAVVGTFGVCFAIWKRSQADVILLAYAAVNYLVFAGTSSDKLYYPRYALPIIVVVTILGGRLAAEVCSRGRVSQVAVVLAVLVCIAVPMHANVLAAAELDNTDTRTIAKNWIEAHIPAGSGILIEGTKIAPSKGTVPLQESREAATRRIEYWRTREPKQARFLALQQSVASGTGYELHFVRVGSIAPYEEYVNRGIRYFVVRPDYFIASRVADSGGADLLKDLRSSPRVRLMFRTMGAPSTPPGPTIEVYGYE